MDGRVHVHGRVHGKSIPAENGPNRDCPRVCMCRLLVWGAQPPTGGSDLQIGRGDCSGAVDPRGHAQSPDITHGMTSATFYESGGFTNIEGHEPMQSVLGSQPLRHPRLSSNNLVSAAIARAVYYIHPWYTN